MNSDVPTFFLRKSAKREIVELDEAVEKRPGRIDLDRQAALGEINLDLVRAFCKTATDLLFMFVEQVLDEFLPRVAGRSSAGYIRLRADAEMTACLTGTCAYFSARSRNW
jgi:hypothetical protein